MSKVRATKDFLHPHDSVIYVAGREFELDDEKLVDYLVGMGTLELVDDEPAPAPAPTAKPAPTKAQLSSGV